MSDVKPLAPLPVRLIVFIVMAVIALASIWLIDRRAMIRMHEIGAGYTLPAPPPAAVQP